MSVILGIPDVLVNNKTRLRARPEFIEEVDEWCRDNMKFDYHLQYCGFSERHDPSKPFQVRFFSENDAIHFKLRWFG